MKLRVPNIFNLRRDPFERADFNSNTYWDWMIDHVFLMYEMQEVVAGQIAGFAKFPPRQKPASFNLDAVLAQVSSSRQFLTFTGSCRHGRGRPHAPRWNRPMQGTIPCMGFFPAPQVS